MAEAIEYAARLADTIGARPAGTEEEQQASFFIEDVLRNEANLPTETEEFNCNLNYELPRTVCCVATAVLGILSIFLPLMVIPSVIITAITAALFITDALDRSLFARFGNSGISQNVLARYTPPSDPNMRGRKRKVLLISHYDSGKVRTEAKGGMLNLLPYLYIAEIVGMALVPVMLLLRLITSATGPLLTIITVFVAIGVVVALLPVLGFLIHQTAQYNKGANVNAAGIAVLLECAKRVQEDPEDLMGDILMSGEESLREQGLVPEGAKLTYEDEVLPDGEEVSQVDFEAAIPQIGGTADGANADVVKGATKAAGVDDVDASNAGAAAIMANADAAIAAATGVPIVGEVAVEVDPRAAYTAAVSQNLPEPEPEEDPNVPEWYRKAMKKAKHEEDDGPVHRSKFADALDNANAVSAVAVETAPAQSEVERRLAQMRASIMGEAGAPGVATAAAAAHGHGGVDGYLSSATDTTTYEAAMADAATPAAGAVATAIPTAASTAASVASSTSRAKAGSGIPAPEDEVRAAAEAAAAAAAKAAAIADKTLSFIPVEVDTDAILRENTALKNTGASAEVGGVPVSAAKSAASAEGATAHERKKRSISLPSLTGAIEGVNARLQDAPLSDKEDEAAAEEKRMARRQARQEKLASSLPSTDSQELPTDDKTQAINLAGSFVSSSATTTFDPLDDEFVGDVDEEEIYVDDADDSDYARVTATGAPARSDYVEMPKSRASRMFGRFRRKKKEEEVSISEAYGLEDEWDARSVGAKRGGWESFREDDVDEFDAYDDDDWNGGAFSKVRDMASSVAKGRHGDTGNDIAGERSARSSRGHRGESAGEDGEGGRSRRSRRTENPFGDLPLTPSMQLNERELIQQFRNGALSCEVWFLAVGAELANNAGIKAFLAAHDSELKGAVVIDLDGLGAGTLSLIDEDGTIMTRKPNARLKRYVTKASSTLGLKLGHGKMRWRNSGAYCTAAHGLQTLHLAGMRDGKPAYGAQADDVIEHVSEETLEQNAAFVMEILRQI